MVIGLYVYRSDQFEESLNGQLCVKVTSFRSEHLWDSLRLRVLVFLDLSGILVFLEWWFYVCVISGSDQA